MDRFRFALNPYRQDPVPAARVPPPVGDALAFHRSLPGYQPTPLLALPALAAELGLAALWLKDEGPRFGLGAFKALGASWAIHRWMSERGGGAPATFATARLDAAAMGVGLAQGALDYAVQYAKSPVQFKQPVAEFQGMQFLFADMATRLAAARALTYEAARRMEARDSSTSHFCAMAKLFASDMAMQVTVDAVQALGAYGVVTDHPVERMMRDAKILQIFDGTNQIQRLIIARGLLK